MNGQTDFLLSIPRFILVFIFIYWLFPRWWLGQKDTKSGLESFYAGFGMMLCLSIGAVYLLVITKLYEVISLLAIVILVIWYRIVIQTRSTKKITGKTFDLLEGVTTLRQVFWEPLKKAIKSPLDYWLAQVLNLNCGLHLLAIVAVFGGIIFLRGYDAYSHMALGYSDTYTMLTWMKYLELRYLFYDGIYPQGFPIFLSILHKFSDLDPLMVVKIAGPFSGVMICLSLYFMASKIWESRLAGVVALFTYGIAGSVLGSNVYRQAAALPQEFGIILVFPSIWFGIQLLRQANKGRFIVFTTTLAAVGLIHSMAFFFALLGLGVAGLSFIITREINFHRLLALAKGITLAGLVAVLPAGVGLLMGHRFHQSSAQFATYVSAGKIEAIGGIPPFHSLVWIAFSGLTIWLLVTVVYKKYQRQRELALFAFLFLLIAMGLERLSYTESLVALASRSGELVALTTALGLGGICRLLETTVSKRPVFNTLINVIVIIAVLAYYYKVPLKPPILPKYQSDSEVTQYLRISEEFRYNDWLMISEPEGYNLSLNKGYHIPVATFTGYNQVSDDKEAEWQYTPYTKFPEYLGDKFKEGAPEEKIINEYILIVHQKKVFRSDYLIDEEAIINQRTLAEASLGRWIEAYKSSHQVEGEASDIDEQKPHIRLYHSEEDFDIWLIHQPMSKKEKWRQMWGETDMPLSSSDQEGAEND